jgi:hypothetical protein
MRDNKLDSQSANLCEAFSIASFAIVVENNCVYVMQQSAVCHENYHQIIDITLIPCALNAKSEKKAINQTYFVSTRAKCMTLDFPPPIGSIK